MILAHVTSTKSLIISEKERRLSEKKVKKDRVSIGLCLNADGRVPVNFYRQM